MLPVPLHQPVVRVHEHAGDHDCPSACLCRKPPAVERCGVIAAAAHDGQREAASHLHVRHLRMRTQ
eukprot:scaffold101538_cov69-Phaeocystis_antarctica.AAC.2